MKKPTTAARAQPVALRLGEYHPHYGGHYAGIVRGEDGNPDYYLFVSPKDKGQAPTNLEWGGYGKALPAAEHRHDGAINTAALLADKDAKHPAAEYCSDLTIDGHKDWYLPSREELRLAYINCRDVLDQAWYWSSTQYAGSAYGAWSQYFDNGDQYGLTKDWKGRVRAVRRLVL